MQTQRILLVVGLLAAALWFGGLVTLGAVVAPIVFRTVPAPTSADAMTLVFRRFDQVAMVCAALVLLTEGVRSLLRSPTRSIDVVRISFATLGGALAVWQALSLSPRIDALHRQGAIRGLGDAGLELEAVHRIAEGAAKGQALAVAVVLVLYAATAGRIDRAPRPAQNTPRP